MKDQTSSRWFHCLFEEDEVKKLCITCMHGDHGRENQLKTGGYETSIIRQKTHAQKHLIIIIQGINYYSQKMPCPKLLSF
jgi:hypothetical protein